MLAVQRPRMGSKPPDMPFGYDFNTPTSNYPFPSPPAPAPGTSLLDDNESKFLDSFFDGVSSDHFNYELFNNPPEGPEAGLGWDELPPTFMGTTSSFGQQPSNGLHGMVDMSAHMSTPPIAPAATADVLAAAALLQNGAGRSHSMSDGVLLRGQDLHMRSTNGHPRSQSVSQHSNRPSGFDLNSTGDDYMRDTFYTDMIFGSRTQPTAWARNPGTTQRADIRWGSDAGFGTPQGFVPPESQDNAEAVERSHVHVVENAFSIGASRVPGSADTTAPPSPIVERGHGRIKSISQIHDKEGQDSRPRKRRKSKFEEEAEEDDESPASAAPKQSNNRKRKSFKKETKESEEPDTSENGHKRRKSAAANAASKATRENLTEEQKRENHIKSEQKRRTLIREGFEDLNELVPGLRGGGFSKSAVLIMAADWLEDLVQGNQVLQRRLDQMEGR